MPMRRKPSAAASGSTSRSPARGSRPLAISRRRASGEAGWASKTRISGRPHVIRDGAALYHVLFRQARQRADERHGLCLAVATATLAAGPFVDMGHPLQCGDGFVNIDPMAFDDPATGKRLLYWGSGFEPIKVQELGPDRISFAPGSSRDRAGLRPTP